ALPIHDPASSTRISAISPLRPSRISAARFKISARALKGVAAHSAEAAAAASTAFLALSAVPSGTDCQTSPVAGFISSNVPEAATHSPPIYILYALRSTVTIEQTPQKTIFAVPLKSTLLHKFRGRFRPYFINTHIGHEF